MSSITPLAEGASPHGVVLPLPASKAQAKNKSGPKIKSLGPVSKAKPSTATPNPVVKVKKIMRNVTKEVAKVDKLLDEVAIKPKVTHGGQGAPKAPRSSTWNLLFG